jgi:hypothetical protein
VEREIRHTGPTGFAVKEQTAAARTGGRGR